MARKCKYHVNFKKLKEETSDITSINPSFFQGPLEAERLIEFCKSRHSCPYFMSKALLAKVDVVICNYQWVFNPEITYRFLKLLGVNLKDCYLILDEAHNIIDVATEVNSKRLTPYQARKCLADLNSIRCDEKFKFFARMILNHLDRRKHEIPLGDTRIDASNVLRIMKKKLGLTSAIEFNVFLDRMRDVGREVSSEKRHENDSSPDHIDTFVSFWEKFADNSDSESFFFCYNVRVSQKKRYISMEIIALDPRDITGRIFNSVRSTLCLSGTVNSKIFSAQTALDRKKSGFESIIAQSPFPSRNIKAIITKGVNTSGSNRTPQMYKKMISKIDEIVSTTPANVGIFCASYKILKDLMSHGIESIVSRRGKRFFHEQSGSSASQNASMLANFKKCSKNQGAVLLGVAGGRNSEGEDFPGNFMNAVIIAGIPYHLPTPRVEAKIKYYDKVFFKQGWNYAYLSPAMQRANQASGRPIRKVSDKGVIVFMDSRFEQRLKWISEWVRKEIEIIADDLTQIKSILIKFWNG